jgi:ABC-type sugar transport system substrate-binding protein
VRPSAAVVIATITVCVLSACGSGSADTAAGSADTAAGPAATQAKPIRLGFSPLSLDIPGLQATADALKNAGAGAGIKVTVADPKFNVQTQVNQVRQWIQLGQVDAVWIIPIAPPAIAPLIAQAQAAKIPILVDTQPAAVGLKGAQPGVSFAFADYTALGTALGTMLTECVAKRTGGSAQVIQLKDPSGQTGNAETDAAIAKVLAGAPNVKIVKTIGAQTQLVAQQSTLSALQAAPGANAALGTNDEAALGALAAFQQAGKDLSKVCVVGGGAADQAAAAVKAGTIYGGITFDFETDTRNNITEIMAMRGDPTAVGKVLTVPFKTVNAP